MFAESQDYGIHGERVRNACWGYLCQSGAMELKEVKIQNLIAGGELGILHHLHLLLLLLDNVIVML